MLDMQLSFLRILGFKGFSSPSSSPFSCPELCRSGKRENSLLLSFLSCNEALFAFQIPPLSKGRLGGDCESFIQLQECRSEGVALRLGVQTYA